MPFPAGPANRTRSGPALFTCGFRPFFLFGSLYAALAVVLWVPWFLGLVHLPTEFPPVAWHIHELMFGYVAAVVTGFLLTALPNWTGRPPVSGWLLVSLFGAWVAARAAVNLSSMAGYPVAAALSLAFTAFVLVVVGRELIAGRNWRNLKVLALLAALLASQIVFLWEVGRYGVGALGDRLAFATILLLMTLVAGRIVPAFTGNWLRARGEARLPPSFGRYDLVTVTTSAVGILLWVGDGRLSPSGVTGAVLLFSAALHLLRQLRWRPQRTLRNPLVAILHVAYAFLPAGFALAGLAEIADLDAAGRAAVHAWTVGAFGTMTLAVMTRASLGHTGRALRASPLTVCIYLAVVVAAVARIVAALRPDWTMAAVPLAGAAWTAAFLGFSLRYGPMLVMPRRPT